MTKSKLMVTLALAFGVVSACNYSGEVGGNVHRENIRGRERVKIIKFARRS